tara:strand:+ start:2229 stop:2522 length:294 start_codon:yes stop_codon:yes gene_type:complete
MSHGIHKNDINRWFLVYDNDEGEEGFVLFGFVGPIEVNQIMTGQPNILPFLTEDELEIYLDNIAGENYYKNAVESASEKFQGPSQKYEPIIVLESTI